VVDAISRRLDKDRDGQISIQDLYNGLQPFKTVPERESPRNSFLEHSSPRSKYEEKKGSPIRVGGSPGSDTSKKSVGFSMEIGRGQSPIRKNDEEMKIGDLGQQRQEGSLPSKEY